MARKSALYASQEPPEAFAQWRVHDARRTLATGLQRLGVRFEVTEAVLNHVSGSRSGVAGVYQRHGWGPEKRAALDSWGRTSKDYYHRVIVQMSNRLPEYLELGEASSRT